ncbi:PEP-CTERM sorting domain-containing protein [Methylophilus sp. QUAN]|uniref:PEP-CTERM sorting domain-containing protein n=1 Tax=Methylophilus sp. QUAN TaxID=2781020 RepID=UPI001890096E|nr:PEP-CTERM sorting domain-containing protein [Methylophilus sp. QUAN]MBF4991779.1 PEP-CTERM sorting domain-containing protein [Methylophilus sp. QUAN]
MKVSNVLGSMALISAISFSHQAFATTNVTDLGDLNAGPVVDQSLLQIDGLWLPDLYKFDLSSDSTVTVDFKALLGIGIGSTFSLYDSSNHFISSYNIPLLTFGATTTFTFANLAAGDDYVFKFNPGALNVTLKNKLTFTAYETVPVPEPESNALMLVGLGIIGLIARRKFA